MADELAQAETTAEQETAQQTDLTTESVSEDAKDTSAVEGQEQEGKGDFKTAMFEERRRRQDLEARLNDPQFAYELARQHGLTEEEEAAEEAANTVPSVAPSSQDVARMVDRRVEAQLDFKEAVRLMPEVTKDPELKAWAASLVESGKSHLEAVRIIQKRLGTVREEGRGEGAEATRSQITDKERAQTATVTQPVDSEAVEMIELRKRASNPWDKKAQEAAHVELIKRRHRQAGYFPG